MTTTPSVKVQGGWRLAIKTGEEENITEESIDELLPWEKMMEFEDLLGDGNAKVTAGFNLGHTENYGDVKAEAFCSVTLTCGQDRSIIVAATEEAAALAKSQCTEFFIDSLATARSIMSDI